MLLEDTLEERSMGGKFGHVARAKVRGRRVYRSLARGASASWGGIRKGAGAVGRGASASWGGIRKGAGAVGRGASAAGRGITTGGRAYGRALTGKHGRGWQAGAIGGTAAGAAGAAYGGYRLYKHLKNKKRGRKGRRNEEIFLPQERLQVMEAILAELVGE